MSLQEKYTVEDALKITLGISAEDYKRMEIEEAHRLCVLPHSLECMKGVMRRCGFAKKSGRCIENGITGFCSYLNENCPQETAAIARLYESRTGVGMVPILNDGSGFAPASGDPKLRHKLIEAWICDPGMAALNICTTPRKARSYRIPDDTDYFRYFNANPKGKLTRDCMLRAVAAACGISWDEALDKLAQYDGDVVNTAVKLKHLMSDEGFLIKPCFRTEHSLPTVRELCDKFNRELHNGEVVLAIMGRREPSHAAAILPVTENGVTRYKVHDTFDCSWMYSGIYWVAGERARAESVRTRANNKARKGECK